MPLIILSVAAAVAGIGIVAGTEVVIFANDPTVLAGAMHAFSGKKWTRAMEISRVNKIPYVQFVESAGGDLRMGGGKGKGASQGTVLGSGHFAESGRTFYDVTELIQIKNTDYLNSLWFFYCRRCISTWNV